MQGIVIQKLYIKWGSIYVTLWVSQCEVKHNWDMGMCHYWLEWVGHLWLE